MATFLNESSWWALLGTIAAFFVAITALALLAGVVLERHYQKQGLTIFAVKLKRGQPRLERLGNALFLVTWIPLATLAVHYELLRFNAGLSRELVTFGVCWVGFTVYYWFLHRAMHTKPLFWIHRWHHESLVTTPWTGLSMSPFEALGWIVGFLGPALVLSHVGWLGAWGYATFFAIHFYGNVVGHANAELMPPFLARMNYVGNPVVYHSLHHARFDGHYGFGAGYMDALFRTEFDDWRAVHAKVLRGEALRSLRERGDTPTPNEPEAAS
ncbi:MAG: sterol desaturase family protein [Myxococcota bacterium]|jgi:sterol desaturase/sphingolipid hydroxylase (fatty acid hydroxylase superfamily)|nr:sterol desaturase family protein [Myxococcota bacterium]